MTVSRCSGLEAAPISGVCANLQAEVMVGPDEATLRIQADTACFPDGSADTPDDAIRRSALAVRDTHTASEETNGRRDAHGTTPAVSGSEGSGCVGSGLDRLQAVSRQPMETLTPVLAVEDHLVLA